MSYDTRLVADLRQLLTLRQHYYPEGKCNRLRQTYNRNHNISFRLILFT